MAVPPSTQPSHQPATATTAAPTAVAAPDRATSRRDGACKEASAGRARPR